MQRKRNCAARMHDAAKSVSCTAPTHTCSMMQLVAPSRMHRKAIRCATTATRCRATGVRSEAGANHA